MPRRLGADARRIEQQVESQGRLTDLMYLSRELKKVVYKDQNTTAGKPAALVQVDADDLLGLDLAALADMTGMALVAANAGKPKTDKPKPPAVKLLGGAGGKWCNRCPHPNGCYFDPNWEGPLPTWLHLSAERKAPYVKGRMTNAKTAGVTCATLKSPSDADIEAYKANRGRGGRGRGGVRGGRTNRGGVPGGVVVDVW